MCEGRGSAGGLWMAVRVLAWCLRIAITFRWLPSAVADYRGPRRFAFSGAWEGALAFWTAPALWRYGTQLHAQF